MPPHIPAQRVYLDTNIVGGYLRYSPGDITKFKSALAGGYRYYASVEVLGELACNSDQGSFATQMRTLGELVTPSCIYHQPGDLIKCDLVRFADMPLRSLLVDHDEVLRMQRVIEMVYKDEETDRIRKGHRVSIKSFDQFDKEASAEVLKRMTNMDEFPQTFAEYWAWLKSEDRLKDSFVAVCRNKTPQPTLEGMSLLAGNLDSYRAIHTTLVMLKLLPYSRAMSLCTPGKGDGGDIRQAVAGSYCDLFITDDERFRKLLSLASSILPYKVLSPKDFLETHVA